ETDTAPVRRRPTRAGFPTGLLLFGLGGVLLLGVIGYAVFRSFSTNPAGRVESFTNTVGMKMVRLGGGAFRMGAPDGEAGRPKDDEGPVHEVTVRGPFLMSATEVTHGQFAQVMGAAVSRAGGRSASPP